MKTNAKLFSGYITKCVNCFTINLTSYSNTVTNLVRGNPAPQQQNPNSDAVFVNDLGDFLSSIIATGLRGAAAFLTSSNEASQKVAVAVGSAAIPPLLNVTRSYNRVQQSSRNVMNSTASVVPSDTNIRTLSQVFPEKSLEKDCIIISFIVGGPDE